MNSIHTQEYTDESHKNQLEKRVYACVVYYLNHIMSIAGEYTDRRSWFYGDNGLLQDYTMFEEDGLNDIQKEQISWDKMADFFAEQYHMFLMRRKIGE